MKNMRAFLVLIVLTIIPIFVRAQGADIQKVNSFAAAVARAEGFGVHNSLPARNHNPGDIKHNGRYIHFKNDAEGWKALRSQIAKLAAGGSKHYRLTMTINQVSKTYAGDSRWGNIVAKTLGVPPTITLRAYFTYKEPVAPKIGFTPAAIMPDLLASVTPLPILAKN